MFALSAIAVCSLLMVAPQPGLPVSQPTVAKRDLGRDSAGPSIGQKTDKSEAAAGSGHLLKEAAATPSAKFVAVRLRERTCHRGGFMEAVIAGVTYSSSFNSRAGLMLRGAVLRI